MGGILPNLRQPSGQKRRRRAPPGDLSGGPRAELSVRWLLLGYSLGGGRQSEELAFPHVPALRGGGRERALLPDPRMAGTVHTVKVPPVPLWGCPSAARLAPSSDRPGGTRGPGDAQEPAETPGQARGARGEPGTVADVGATASQHVA